MNKLKIAGLIASFIVFFAVLISLYHHNSSMIIEDKQYDLIRKSINESDTDPLIDKRWDMKSSYALRPLVSVLGYNKSIALLLWLSSIITLLALFIAIKEESIIFFVLMLTPFFIRTFVSFSDYTLLAPFAILFLYAISKTSKTRYIFSLLIHSIITILNVYVGIISAAIGIYIYYAKKEGIKSVFFLIPFISILFIEPGSLSNHSNFFQSIFIDFSAQNGLPMALTIIAIIGFIIQLKAEPIMKYLILLGIIILIINIPAGLFILNIMIIYLGSRLIELLIKEEWHSDTLKQLSIFLIFCSILFSGIAYTKTLYADTSIIDENKSLIDAINWIKERTPEDSFVLSHRDYGYKIKYYGNRHVLLDNDIDMIKNGRKKDSDIKVLFETRSIQKAKTILDKYGINYILITNKMKQALVWNRDNQGLIFVMKNNAEFIKSFDNNMTQVWWYNPEMNNKTNELG